MTRLSYFRSRIGKRVYPVDPLCPCRVCMVEYCKGNVIVDDNEARYMADHEADCDLWYVSSKWARWWWKVIKRFKMSKSDKRKPI